MANMVSLKEIVDDLFTFYKDTLSLGEGGQFSNPLSPIPEPPRGARQGGTVHSEPFTAHALPLWGGTYDSTTKHGTL